MSLTRYLIAACLAGASLASTAVAQDASDASKAMAKLPNAAGVTVQVTPDSGVKVGENISFRVTTRKPGYLLLIDIDADGRMTQIFPSPEMIAQSEEAASNYIKPGQELLIPNPTARKLGFSYVVTPPMGAATIVAVLSERRVQLVDLPDDAQKQRSEAEMASYLSGWTNELRVPDPSGKLEPSTWSFDFKPYAIK